jgi:hypothetical protein
MNSPTVRLPAWSSWRFVSRPTRRCNANHDKDSVTTLAATSVSGMRRGSRCAIRRFKKGTQLFEGPGASQTRVRAGKPR